MASGNASTGGALRTARLLACVAGIYTFFLTWGVLQERISTVAYVSADGTAPARFAFFVFLNCTQALACVAVAGATLVVQGRGLGPRDRSMLREYVRMSALACVSSPFGYASLKHISFPIMVLGKSCKLLPVMLMNWVVYRRRFEPRKVLTVAPITLGVAGFLFFEPQRASAKAASARSILASLWGVSLLLVNLLIDGTVNSLQDRVFLARPGLSGLQMMFWMQLSSASLMAMYMAFAPWSSELSSALAFIRHYPAVSKDIALFGLCGALGQVFVFYTLEHFGSLTLVTVTVTRKLATILLSLFWFNHALAIPQWLSVGLVFVALVMEAMAPKGPRGTSISKAASASNDVEKDASEPLLPSAMPIAHPNRALPTRVKAQIR
jgi:solute carrier family 35 (UDP-galactose transporter), member B1